MGDLDLRARRGGPPAGRRVLLAFAIPAVAALLLVELAARVVAPYLPAPKLYGDTTTQVKVAQLASFGSCASVVVAGNSMARAAYDPIVAGDPRAYNAALDAASPALLDRWLGEVVMPSIRPRVVVVAIASLDLNANSKAGGAARQAYDDAPATAAGGLGRVGAVLTERSAAVRHRRDLTDPQEWAPLLDRVRAGTRTESPGAGGIPGLIGPQGQGLAGRAVAYEPGDPIIRRFTTDQLLNDFAIDERSIGPARALVRHLRDGGATVVLAALPVTEEYVSFHPRGRSDFDRYLDELRNLAASEQVPLLDLHADAPPLEFADTHHLNAAGASRFSRALQGRLHEVGVDPGAC